MPRPKKGEKGYEEATKKWRNTMLAKYGGEKGLHENMQAIGSKGGRAVTIYPKGFAANPALARIAGAKGGRKSTRKGIKNGQGKKANKEIDDIERILEEDRGRD